MVSERRHLVEGAALSAGGVLAASRGTTDLILDASLSARWIDGIVTGVHSPGESHFELLPPPSRRVPCSRTRSSTHARRAISTTSSETRC